MKELKILVYTNVFLMLSTALIYFLAAYLDTTEGINEHAVQIETILFTVVGIIYIPFGIWMLKNELNSRGPYVIAIAISAALIGLYIAAKTIAMPIVGLESNVNVIDIASKVLQVAIVAISVILLPKLKENQSYEMHKDL